MPFRVVNHPRVPVKVGKNTLSGQNHAFKYVGGRGRKVSGARKGDVLSNSHRVG